MSDVSILHVPNQLVVFRVGDTRYGFDIEAVNEILPVLPITATPGAPLGVLGIADVRKRVVPVFDLHWKFGALNDPANKEARLILVTTESGPMGLLVGAVEEVLTVTREDFHSVSTPGHADVGYLSGVVRKQDRLILWVDHRALTPEGLALAAA